MYLIVVLCFLANHCQNDCQKFVQESRLCYEPGQDIIKEMPLSFDM